MTANEKAQRGLTLLKEAILEYLRRRPEGVRNVEVAEALGLQSDVEGQHKNYLIWSLCGLLLNEGKVRREQRGRHRLYFLSSQPKGQNPERTAE